MLVISCHADTCRRSHDCEVRGNAFYGHLDNFVGVHAVMLAYFSGRLHHDFVRIELTYGEETDSEGARQVLATLRKRDTVIVVDVTGTPTTRDFVIEKCKDPAMTSFLTKALKRFRFDLYEDCPDPVANEDEVDVYVEKIPRTFFLGVPVFGGDYNREKVSVRRRSVQAVAGALCAIADAYPAFCKSHGLRAD